MLKFLHRCSNISFAPWYQACTSLCRLLHAQRSTAGHPRGGPTSPPRRIVKPGASGDGDSLARQSRRLHNDAGASVMLYFCIIPYRSQFCQRKSTSRAADLQNTQIWKHRFPDFAPTGPRRMPRRHEESPAFSKDSHDFEADTEASALSITVQFRRPIYSPHSFHASQLSGSLWMTFRVRTVFPRTTQRV